MTRRIQSKNRNAYRQRKLHRERKMIDRLEKGLSTISMTKLDSLSKRSLKEILDDFHTFDTQYRREYRTIAVGSDEMLNTDINKKKTKKVTDSPIRTMCTRSFKLKNIINDSKPTTDKSPTGIVGTAIKTSHKKLRLCLPSQSNSNNEI